MRSPALSSLSGALGSRSLGSDHCRKVIDSFTETRTVEPLVQFNELWVQEPTCRRRDPFARYRYVVFDAVLNNQKKKPSKRVFDNSVGLEASFQSRCLFEGEESFTCD